MAKLQSAPNPYDFADDTPVTSDEGDTSVTLRTKPHTGKDYAMPAGADVRAQYGGTVLSASDAGDFGLTVVVLHPATGTQTQYSHLGEMSVKPGDQVERGGVLGKVGSTGKSTGPHLHYEENPLGAPIGYRGPGPLGDDKPKPPPSPSPGPKPPGPSNPGFQKNYQLGQQLLQQSAGRGARAGALGIDLEALFSGTPIGEDSMRLPDRITRNALKGGMNPVGMASDLWQRQHQYKSLLAWAQQLAGGFGESDTSVLGKLDSLNPKDVYAALTRQATPVGSDVLGPAVDAKRHAAAGTPNQGPQQLSTDEIFKANELAGVTPVQAAFMADPSLARNVVAMLGYGNSGLQQTMGNYLERVLLPRYLANQPEYAAQGKTIMNLLADVMPPQERS